MSKIIHIEPFKQELPSEFADRLGVYYTQQVTTTHKKVNGQLVSGTTQQKLTVADGKSTGIKPLKR